MPALSLINPEEREAALAQDPTLATTQVPVPFPSDAKINHYHVSPFDILWPKSFKGSYPPENWNFDRTIQGDLQKGWGLGPNQTNAFASGERSASEASIIQSNFQTEISVMRARVATFVTNVFEVTAGLLALYGNFTYSLNHLLANLPIFDRCMNERIAI